MVNLLFYCWREERISVNLVTLPFDNGYIIRILKQLTHALVQQDHESQMRLFLLK